MTWNRNDQLYNIITNLKSTMFDIQSKHSAVIINLCLLLFSFVHSISIQSFLFCSSFFRRIIFMILFFELFSKKQEILLSLFLRLFSQISHKSGKIWNFLITLINVPKLKRWLILNYRPKFHFFLNWFTNKFQERKTYEIPSSSRSAILCSSHISNISSRSWYRSSK